MPPSAAPPVTRPSEPHLPALDGLRCCAFLAVFLHHAIPARTPYVGALAANAWSGVDLFFTLSGFLVTWLLLREESRRERETGRPGFSLWRFWGRRSLRIWPLYFLTLALTLYVLPRAGAAWTREPSPGSPAHDALVGTYGLPSVGFLLNWSIAEHGWPGSSIKQLWSVCVEEQIYVLWPLLLSVVPRGWRTRFAAFGIAAAVLAKAVVDSGGPTWTVVYVNTFLRMDTFLVGALLAIPFAEGRLPNPRLLRWSPVIVTVAGVALALLPPRDHPSHLLAAARYALVDVFAVGGLTLALVPGGRAAAVLSSAVPTALGRMSYGLYCFHLAAIDSSGFLWSALHEGNHTLQFVAARAATALAATVVLAWASLRWFESWFLRLKTRLR